MYARETFAKHMSEFEPGEMVRIPLDSVILMLKEMVSDENVREVLASCLEPPNMMTIERSFESLFQSHFITRPDDDCEITTLGSFVSALGIDLALGSLIGLGIQFGVGAEAIQLAAILSFPKTPFVMSNPLIHEPEAYNGKSTNLCWTILWNIRLTLLLRRKNCTNIRFSMPFRCEFIQRSACHHESCMGIPKHQPKEAGWLVSLPWHLPSSRQTAGLNMSQSPGQGCRLCSNRHIAPGSTPAAEPPSACDGHTSSHYVSKILGQVCDEARKVYLTCHVFAT